jgi:hypothetical protein
MESNPPASPPVSSESDHLMPDAMEPIGPPSPDTEEKNKHYIFCCSIFRRPANVHDIGDMIRVGYRANAMNPLWRHFTSKRPDNEWGSSPPPVGVCIPRILAISYYFSGLAFTLGRGMHGLLGKAISLDQYDIETARGSQEVHGGANVLTSAQQEDNIVTEASVQYKYHVEHESILLKYFEEAEKSGKFAIFVAEYWRYPDPDANGVLDRSILGYSIWQRRGLLTHPPDERVIHCEILTFLPKRSQTTDVRVQIP